MIDKQYQKKGYGKEALMCGITYLREKFNVREVYTGVLLGNEIAKHLYTSVGFVETGINMRKCKRIPVIINVMSHLMKC